MKMEVMSVQNVLCGGFLLAGSVFDLYEKKIPLWLPVMCGIFAGGIRLEDVSDPGRMTNAVSGTVLMVKILFPLLPGLLLIIFSLLSGNSIGIGDGISTAAAALCTGCLFMLRIMTLAFVLASGYSIVFLVLHRIHAGTKIPFLPFLFTAYIILLLWPAV